MVSTQAFTSLGFALSRRDSARVLLYALEFDILIDMVLLWVAVNSLNATKLRGVSRCY